MECCIDDHSAAEHCAHVVNPSVLLDCLYLLDDVLPQCILNLFMQDVTLEGMYILSNACRQMIGCTQRRRWRPGHTKLGAHVPVTNVLSPTKCPLPSTARVVAFPPG